RFELATSTLARWRSSQLSYVRMLISCTVPALSELPFRCVPTSKNSIRRFPGRVSRGFPRNPHLRGDLHRRTTAVHNPSGRHARIVVMTSPALAHQTAYGRMYSRKLDGLPEVPSITTVIGQASMSLDGWVGHMAATAVTRDDRLPDAVGNAAKLRTVARDASNAAEVYRNSAAERGDRVHTYCEQVALRALGRPHAAAE